MNQTSRNVCEQLALPLLCATLLMLSACGLLVEQPKPEPQPVPQPMNTGHDPAWPQTPQPVAQADNQDWLDEYNRTLERILAGEVVAPTPVQPMTQPMVEPMVQPMTQPQPVMTTPEPLRVPDPAPLQPQPVMSQPEAFAPRGAGLDDGALQQLLQQSRQHASVIDERTAALVQSFVGEGLAAMDAGDIQGAHELFGSAVEIDPADPAARALFDQTGMLLGDGSASLSGIATSAKERSQARREQQRILVQHELEQGRTAMINNNPERAQRHFEDALAMIRASSDIGPGSPLEAQAGRMVMEAKAAKLNADRRRETELIGRASDLQQSLDRADATRGIRRKEHLLNQANDAFVRHHYSEAETYLEEALADAPDDAELLDLWRVVNRARHDETQESTRREYSRQWKATFDELENTMMPPNDLITFPKRDVWAEISNRGSKTLGGIAGKLSLSDQQVKDELDRIRIPVDFQGMLLDEVISHLQEVTGVNFIISPEAQDLGSDNDYDFTDRANQPVSRILKILLEDLSNPPLNYTIRDGVVRIISEDETRGDYVLEMYDIRDLTVIPTDYSSNDFNLLPSGTDTDSFLDGVEDEDPVAYIGEDSLLSLIEENIDTDGWSDDPERTIQLLPGTLVVRQVPEVHAQIRSLLNDLRANTMTMVHIETRFIEVEDSFLEDIGVDLRGLDDAELEDFGQSGVGFGTSNNPFGIGTGNDAGAFYSGSNGDLKLRTENLFDFTLGESGTLNNAGGLSLQALFLDDTDVQAVLRAVTKYENSNIVNAPSLSLRSGHRGTIEVVTNRTYVYDFEPEIAQAAVIAQPELRNVKEGIVLDVRAVASADRRFITLELRPTLAELVRDRFGDPLPDQLVSLATGNAADVTIELPELRIQRLRTTATVPDGATLMLGGLKRSVDQNIESGLPWISDIPIIGFFFTRKGDYQSRRKLLILMKATLTLPEELEPGV